MMFRTGLTTAFCHSGSDGDVASTLAIAFATFCDAIVAFSLKENHHETMKTKTCRRDVSTSDRSTRRRRSSTISNHEEQQKSMIVIRTVQE